jgi:hypothetical protein
MLEATKCANPTSPASCSRISFTPISGTHPITEELQKTGFVEKAASPVGSPIA